MQHDSPLHRAPRSPACRRRRSLSSPSGVWLAPFERLGCRAGSPRRPRFGAPRTLTACRWCRPRNSSPMSRRTRRAMRTARAQLGDARAAVRERRGDARVVPRTASGRGLNELGLGFTTQRRSASGVQVGAAVAADRAAQHPHLAAPAARRDLGRLHRCEAARLCALCVSVLSAATARGTAEKSALGATDARGELRVVHRSKACHRGDRSNTMRRLVAGRPHPVGCSSRRSRLHASAPPAGDPRPRSSPIGPPPPVPSGPCRYLPA
jgi:hypothetical protein